MYASELKACFIFFRNSAEKIDPKVQKGLFMFAVSNSCMDPLVYGEYPTSMDVRQVERILFL